MTQKSGFVSIPLTKREAEVGARSLLWAIRVLSGDKLPLKQLVRILVKAKRYERASVQIPRNLAMDAAVSLDAIFVLSRLVNLYLMPDLTFLVRCREAISRKRGRPRLTRKQVKTWIGNDQGDERERRRLKKRERIEQWLDEIKARGETLLTATLPPP